jgi:hypothetical protein
MASNHWSNELHSSVNSNMLRGWLLLAAALPSGSKLGVRGGHDFESDVEVTISLAFDPLAAEVAVALRLGPHSQALLLRPTAYEVCIMRPRAKLALFRSDR